MARRYLEVISSGEASAARLNDAGVPVTLTCYDGMIHPFLNFLGVTPAAGKAIDQIAAAFRSMAPGPIAGRA